MTDPDSGFDHEAFLASLSRRPGVYRMLDGQGDVLYVGKARDLRARVSSYFRASGLAAKTIAMVNRIREIEVTVTASETEALLLEQSLIKELRPPYNIVLRDDKSYPYIHVTEGDYPRLNFHRGSRKRPGRFFGPFPSAAAVRESINVLQKLFQIRNCTDSYFKNRSRPCLQHQIGRCTAPCVDLITAEEYAEDVRNAQRFLEGRSGEVLRDMQEAMDEASHRLDFEKAARLRDQIAQLARVQEQQDVVGAENDADVVVCIIEPGGICVQVMSIRGGRLLGSRDYFPRDELESGPDAVLTSFLSQYYLGAGTDAVAGREIPREVIVSHPLSDEPILAAALDAAAPGRVRLTSRVRGHRARWVRLAQANAAESLGRHLADRSQARTRLRMLQGELGLADAIERLECFDISHTAGENTVASCVVFGIEGPLKSDYRRFNITGIQGGDDYAAMEQALRRRYARLKEGEAALPDVLFIDGGKGQVARARGVLAELEVEGVRIIGVAKGTTRKAGLETLIDAETGMEVVLDTAGPAMHLVQHIRDEAHRFAITGHRQRRGKQRVRSELEGIDGVGPKRRRALLQHFGGARGVRNASVDDLARVPGISRTLAEHIYGALH